MEVFHKGLEAFLVQEFLRFIGSFVLYDELDVFQ